MGAAPQCMLTPNEPDPSAPAINFPSIPVPNGQNTLAVLQALRNAINVLTNQVSHINRNNNNNNQNNNVPPPNNRNQFHITNQVVKNVKVFDPNDPTGQTYVTVAQVTALTMRNPVSGDLWNWSAPANIPNG